MVELKTLKDIERVFIDFKNHPEYDLNIEGISLVDLRKEAIKWVKELATKQITLTNGLPVTVEGSEIYYLNRINSTPLIFFIKHFFNLTEDDIK